MRVFLPAIILAACCGITGATGQTPGTPDFTGLWWHPSLPGPEPLASGPTTVINRSRTRAGISDYGQLVGDYNNPILKPEAAAVVKRFGEISLAGRVFPSPANQCWPEPGPFIYKNFALEMFQKPDEITLIYDQDHEVRHVRLNQQHPKNLKPSWYGDSIGHYEGSDTLVVDTVGIKTDRPYAMIDLYGTPYTGALHMIERYRLIGYDEAQEGIERDKKENMRVAWIRTTAANICRFCTRWKMRAYSRRHGQRPPPLAKVIPSGRKLYAPRIRTFITTRTKPSPRQKSLTSDLEKQ